MGKTMENGPRREMAKKMAAEMAKMAKNRHSGVRVRFGTHFLSISGLLFAKCWLFGDLLKYFNWNTDKIGIVQKVFSPKGVPRIFDGF